MDSQTGALETAAALAALLTLDPWLVRASTRRSSWAAQAALAHGVYWGDLNDLAGQEWGWFATALYAERAPDLWRSGTAQSADEAAS